jgi:hypothetical protein
MKPTRTLLPLIAVLSLPIGAQGQSRNELELGSDVAAFGAVADIPLRLSTTDQVEGIVAAFDWDTDAAVGVALVPGPAIAGADTVVQRVEADYMVLGVVMDSDGEGDEIIAPGNDLLVATAQIRCGNTAGVMDIELRDGAYATVEDGVLLDNLVVVGGLSIGAAEGLILTNGRLECVEGFNRLMVEQNAGTAEGERCGNARVIMENRAPVEGYVVALCHDSADLTLDSIQAGAAATAAAADFVEAEVFPTGGTLGVVIDLVAPFTGNTIPAGDANHAATFRYCCRTIPPAGETETSVLMFCDNVLGAPLRENVIVIDGASISSNEGLELEDGMFTCRGGDEPVVVEICDNGIDDDGDGLTDLADPDCQKMFACGSRVQEPVTGNPVGPVEGSIGSPVEVCYYLKSPEDNQPGSGQADHIQGFSMGIAFCCDTLTAREIFDIEGTILEAVGAEFVSIQVDNGMGTGPLEDGDPECEIVIGVLLDTLPPFEGQTIPPLPGFQRVGCVTFDIADRQDLCGDCCTIDFKDGVLGRGKVPIKNLISTENKSSSPQLMDCQVCVKDKERFFRGDCNFMPMPMGMSVDIADAAAVVSALFGIGDWKFHPPCLDACDCNDDGRMDLADAICILQFLFQFGRFPPAPGPGFSLTSPDLPAGPDPTPDKLDCAGGGDCPGA